MRSRAASSFWEIGKFPLPAFAHRLGKTGFEVAEKHKGPQAGPLFAHEQQRDLRRQQHDGDAGVQCGFRRTRCEAHSEGVVADMVMILQKRDKGGRRQLSRCFATRPSAAKRRRLALIDKTFRQCAPEMPRRRDCVIAIEPRFLAGDQHMQGVVQIVVPLRAEALDPALGPP